MKKDRYDLGPLNCHAVGRILKETVRRAIVAIRTERLTFEATPKRGRSGTMDDVCTSADTKAQKIYLDAITECFPDCGVVAEENNLRIEPRNGCRAYFTVDPLDGTKAYVRRQSHGVATMVALIYDDKVISAYIGDVNTQEVYGYRPESKSVHRITQLDSVETLSAPENSNPRQKYALLRNPAGDYSTKVQGILSNFKSHEVIGSSIGTWMAQLWKQEVAAVFLEPSHETPWDRAPIIGISEKLGYKFFRPITERDWVEWKPVISKETVERGHETMIIHPSDLNKILH